MSRRTEKNTEIEQEVNHTINKDSLENKRTEIDINQKNNEKETKQLYPDSVKHELIDKYDLTFRGGGNVKKVLRNILDNMQNKEKGVKAFEFFIHNIPKVLFIYMPLFAFWLWLFHNKKKKYYFDSAIFTLHFFSIVLLTITISSIISCAFDWLNLSDTPYAILYCSVILYITFYFFRGNRVFFEESRLISNLKSFILIGINNFFIFLFFILYIIFVVYIIYA